jgi:hypothetical protein
MLFNSTPCMCIRIIPGGEAFFHGPNHAYVEQESDKLAQMFFHFRNKNGLLILKVIIFIWM